VFFFLLTQFMRRCVKQGAHIAVHCRQQRSERASLELSRNRRGISSLPLALGSTKLPCRAAENERETLVAEHGVHNIVRQLKSRHGLDAG
jgi:hypothetical protein